MILPYEGFKGDSPGEDLLWNLFRHELPRDYISFHGYYIGVRRPDIILLVPDLGVLIIENKSIYAKNVVRVPNNRTILMNHSPAIPSPLNQAMSYADVLRDTLLAPNGIDQVMVGFSVAYPYITEQEFQDAHLDKISLRELTFLREDLESFETIKNRITIIFDMLYDQIHVLTISRGGFHLGLMDKVANLISPHFREEQLETLQGASPETPETEPGIPQGASPETPEIEPGIPQGAKPKTPGNEYKIPDTKPNTPFNDQIDPHYNKEDYSILLISPDGSAFDENKITELKKAWLRGTKLQLYTGNTEVHGALLKEFGDLIQDRDLPEKEFALKHNLSFRLEIGLISDPEDGRLREVQLINGEGYPQQDSVLLALDELSSFNRGQYQMEHAPQKNIKVTAGAGTGKTFSMLSRIRYLIWKDQVAPEDLKTYLFMITFTNKSAEEMRHRLFAYFLNDYFLTRNPLYFQYLEAVQDIQISTIHSLCRRVLERFSTRLGLGNAFQIATGTWRRREILREELDAWLEEPANRQYLPKMKMYFLSRRLEEFLDKIDNKNVDLVRDWEDLDFGDGPRSMPFSLMKVLARTQERLENEMAEQNRVCLHSLIRKMGELRDLLTEADFPEFRRIHYLFVDEFQDTDNVQIELIQRFQEIVHFYWFVVGDTKQCIYRFRGAEDNAFERLTEGVEHETISLRKNYRTDKILLKKMNHCFQAWDKRENLFYQGEDVLVGVVNQPLDEPLEAVSCGYGLDEGKLVQVINEAVERAEEVDGTVAILVRNNYQIENIQAICRKYRISLSTEVGGRLFQSDPTIDLYKLLLALQNQDAPEYLFNLYTTSYLKTALPKRAVSGLSRAEQVKYFNAHCGIKDWMKLKADVQVEPILQVLQKIIQNTRPWDRFAEMMNDPDREKKNKNYYTRNLDQIFENLIHIANSDYLTLNKLTDYLEIMIATRQEAEERESFESVDEKDRLICTTVHKSKGLEFDTVILPFCSLSINNTIDKGNVDVVFDRPKVAYRLTEKVDVEQGKGLKPIAYSNTYYEEIRTNENRSREREETRILYVAMTRAQRKLVCFLTPAKKKVTWSTLIQEGLA